MTIVDWRQTDERGLALLYARERARWLVELGWETRESWAHVERARTTWGLPGLAAIDESGRVRGATFFHATGGRFEIGGVCAESDALRETLLDAAVDVCEVAGGEEVAAFLYTGMLPAPGALAARGFAVDQVDYLRLSLDEGNLTAGEGRRLQVTYRDWQPGDVDALAALLHASYEAHEVRRFVPDATEQGWRHYVGTLVEHHACGTVLPSTTRLAVVGDTLVGAALVTDLGPATAHIAQVAVHPSWRRKGLAAHLIDEAARLAGASGYVRMTLLASADNAAAQELYRCRGYVQGGTFLAATRPLHGRCAAQAS